MAYDDPGCTEEDAIVEEVEKLSTLLKIDVRNLARCEPLFRNRVEATGRVLYSATKRLRFEDALSNFRTACERFAQALAERPVFYQVGFGEAYTDVVAKRFEFAYEMAWRTLSRYFDYVGIGCATPRACFKEAHAQGIVGEEEVWLEMIEHRELLADSYDLLQNHEIMARAERFRTPWKGCSRDGEEGSGGEVAGAISCARPLIGENAGGTPSAASPLAAKARRTTVYCLASSLAGLLAPGAPATFSGGQKSENGPARPLP